MDRLNDKWYQTAARGTLESIEGGILIRQSKGEFYKDGTHRFFLGTGSFSLSKEEEAILAEAQKAIPAYFNEMVWYRSGFRLEAKDVLLDRLEEVAEESKGFSLFRAKPKYYRFAKDAKRILVYLHQYAREDGIELGMQYWNEWYDDTDSSYTDKKQVVPGNWNVDFLFPKKNKKDCYLRIEFCYKVI